MKKILLVCNAGMSTSLLVTNMEKYAKKENIEITIMAVPLTQVDSVVKDWDIVMLGPQVRHCLNQIKNIVDGRIPVEIIDMMDYGMMNGEKVLKRALELLDNEKV